MHCGEKLGLLDDDGRGWRHLKQQYEAGVEALKTLFPYRQVIATNMQPMGRQLVEKCLLAYPRCWQSILPPSNVSPSL